MSTQKETLSLIEPSLQQWIEAEVKKAINYDDDDDGDGDGSDENEIENDEQRNIAMQLVDDEMYSFPPEKDYLAHLPNLEQRPFATPLAEHEHARIENDDKPKYPSSELARIVTEVPPPAHSMMTEDEFALWSRSVDQLKIKLEYQQRQLINLELLRKFGVLDKEH